MDELEIQKLELQLHNLQGRVLQHKLALIQLPVQEKQLNEQILATADQIDKVVAQLETLKSTTDTASI